MGETICSHMSNRLMFNDRLTFVVGVVSAMGDAYYWPYDHKLSSRGNWAKPDYYVRVTPRRRKHKESEK